MRMRKWTFENIGEIVIKIHISFTFHVVTSYYPLRFIEYIYTYCIIDMSENNIAEIAH